MKKKNTQVIGIGCWLHQESVLHSLVKGERHWQVSAVGKPEVHLFAALQTGCCGNVDNHKFLIETTEGVREK